MVRQRLTEAERERIREAVAHAEARTGAQLVVVIADTCGSYGVFGALWAALAALLAGAITVLAAPWIPAAWVVLIEGSTLLVVAAVLAWPPLLMQLVPHRTRHAHARLVAEQQFAARVGGRTGGGIGVLLFLALAEHQVVILPDSGVAAAVDDGQWREIVARLTARAHEGALTPAIAEAIDSMAQVLMPHFPPETPPENPLADEVIELGKPAGPKPS